MRATAFQSLLLAACRLERSADGLREQRIMFACQANNAAANSLSLINTPSRTVALYPTAPSSEWISAIVPSIGRFIVPKKGSHVNPFTYNPITGTNGGNGVSITGVGGSTGGSNYISGGDDATLPNPGVEVRTAGGAVPVPSRH
ncbi:hypothetical protein BUALT_Bualt18G0022900 [Buddleja alternifolia]|uniref:Uncharacterized protein n=1 Tax=Buddleja alternifolia TaxID=168488 RepID=A0AAV6W897_9LAMI|nr:hypothetical protein BUALT_Bualt18G0022900 [Buddleja alternifolia]